MVLGSPHIVSLAPWLFVQSINIQPSLAKWTVGVPSRSTVHLSIVLLTVDFMGVRFMQVTKTQDVLAVTAGIHKCTVEEVIPVESAAGDEGVRFTLSLETDGLVYDRVYLSKKAPEGSQRLINRITTALGLPMGKCTLDNGLVGKECYIQVYFDVKNRAQVNWLVPGEVERSKTHPPRAENP